MGSLVATVVAVSATAMAAEGDDALRLTWTAPSGCPSSDAVRAAALRGVDARAAKGQPLEAEARVDHETSSWRVQLRTQRGAARGEREIEAATCDGLAEATAVVLALALVASDVERIEAAEPAAAAPPPAPREPDVRPRIDASPSHTFALGASVAGDAATLPSPAVGGSLTLAWTPGRFRLEVDGRRWGSQSGSIQMFGSGARFTMTSVGARGCWAALNGGTLELSPCGGLDLSFVSASGFGADTNYTPDGTWTTIAGGGLARLRLTSWLAVRTKVDAFLPMSRPTFVVENQGSVHRPSPIGVSASFGLEALFL
jgi:hypothetical protein